VQVARVEWFLFVNFYGERKSFNRPSALVPKDFTMANVFSLMRRSLNFPAFNLRVNKHSYSQISRIEDSTSVAIKNSQLICMYLNGRYLRDFKIIISIRPASEDINKTVLNFERKAILIGK
jgi:hypothetical protein